MLAVDKGDSADFTKDEILCPKCNSQHDRDINAATNIRNRGLLDLGLLVNMGWGTPLISNT